MAKQTINVGTSANSGGGDPLRNALIKVNENFDEVYTKLAALEDGNVITDVVGSVFSDDSTLLVDGVNSSINLNGTVKGNIIPDVDEAYDLGSPTKKFRDLYLSGTTIYLGDTPLSIDNGTLLIDGLAVSGTGDVQGSVFADDSTLLVDAVNANIPYSVLSGAPTIPTDINDLTDTGNLLFDGDYGSLTNQPVIPTDVGDLTDTGNLLGGSGDGVIEGSIYKINIAGDDSTLLVDSDNGKIVGYVENDRFTVDGNDYQVRIGVGAGATTQGTDAIAIGEGAGNYQQGTRSVAIGRGSGNADQGLSAVGIGFCAGGAEQGDYAVAIGFKAGRGPMAGDPDPAQPNNSIIINASGDKLNGTNSGLYIDPVREDEANVTKLVYYNTTTKELTYANPTLVSDNDINVTINSADSTSYSWNFNQLGFLEIPNVNNQLGGTIGDTFFDGGIGIKASEAAGSYVELTNRDESAGIFVQGDSTLSDPPNIQVAIYTTNSGGMEFYGDGNAQLFGDLSLSNITSTLGIAERSVGTFTAGPVGVLTINLNQRNGAVRNINTSGIFPFPPLFTANFTVNLTGFTLEPFHLTTVRVEIEQHSSAGYYPSVLQIDGVAQTIDWEGGVNPAPIGGTRDLAVFYIRNTSSSSTPAYSVIGHYIGGNQTRFDGDVTGSVFGDDSTLLVDGVSGKIVGDVAVAEQWKVTVGPDFYTFSYVEGFGSTLGIPGGIRGKLQTALLTGNDIGVSIDGANTPNNVSIGDIANGNTLRIESGSSAGDIILTSSGGMDVRSEGAVTIDINLSDSTTRTWRFGEDGNLDLAGNLRFPDGAEIRESGDGELRLRGAAGKIAQLQGLNTDGFVDSAVKALYNNSVGSFVTIHTNIDAGSPEYIWTFDYNGDLTAPGAITSDNDAGYQTIIDPDSITAVWNGTTIFTIDKGPGGGSINALAGKSFAITTDDNNNFWAFGTDGSLVIPGDIKSNGNINIDINLSDSTLRRWRFGEDGNTEFPGDITLDGVVKHSTIEKTGGANSGTATALDLTKSVQVLVSADADDDSWSLADGVEGQIMYFVPKGAGLNNHYINIANVRYFSEGGYTVGPKTWIPFQIDDNLRAEDWRSLAVAVFTDGAWNTDTSWFD